MELVAYLFAGNRQGRASHPRSWLVQVSGRAVYGGQATQVADYIFTT